MSYYEGKCKDSTPVSSTLADETPSDIERQQFSLPPVDTGKDAWLFLAACFMFEALVWGFPLSFGVFQDYYSTHEPFKGSSKISIIGTCASGILYLITPIVMGFYRLYPRCVRYAPACGLIFLVGALIGSSFATTIPQLIALQGVLYGIGGCMVLCPCVMYMGEWFVKRRGLAFGVMWSGTGLGGLITPLLLEYFIGKFGFRTTLRIWGAAVFVIVFPLIYFIKPRIPTLANKHMKPFDLGFLLQPDIFLYQLCNIVQGAGFFLPGIYLPSYARTTLGTGPLPSAMTVVVINIGMVIGCVIMGALIDRLDVDTCILLCTAGATLSTFFLWGFATNLAVLYIFGLVYGLFAGAYSSAWSGVLKQIKRSPVTSDGQHGGVYSSYDPMMLFSILAAGRGVGNVISGPLSEALLKGMPWQGQAAGGYGSGYGLLIVFTGITAFSGGVSCMLKRIGCL